MTDRRSYTDAELRHAVAHARSWRGVLRALGLTATSSAAIRSVRHHADRLGLDHRHFTGGRRWTEAELAAAVAASHSWGEVAEALGLRGSSSETALRGHAVRLGIGAEHFDAPPAHRPLAAGIGPPDPRCLSRAGSLMAAAWFSLCGHDVSWPLEPCRYDLLVRTGAGFLRVQVKTTTVRRRSSWVVSLASTRGGRVVYGPDEVDHFFVIDGALDHYLIPYAAVGGLQLVALSAYADYRVRTGLSIAASASVEG